MWKSENFKDGGGDTESKDIYYLLARKDVKIRGFRGFKGISCI